MLVQLTPPQPAQTNSPAQQVVSLVGAQISQSANQLQEIIGKAASVVTAAVSTTASPSVGAMLHVGAAAIADTAIGMANEEVDRALRAVSDPLGAGTSIVRDKVASEISHQAQSVERKLGAALDDTNPTIPSKDGGKPFLSQSTSNGEQYESPKSFGEILFGRSPKNGERVEPETSAPRQRTSLVGDTLGLRTKTPLMRSLAA